MTITQKAEKYTKQFEVIKNEETDVRRAILKDTADKKLYDSVQQAHGDRFPNDWIFGTYLDLLFKIGDYDLKTIDDLDNIRGEIVDSFVDIYTTDLTSWLASDICNVDYLTEAIQEFGVPEDGVKLLAQAQYMAIDEVMTEVYNLLAL